jgi:hypothetical protein
MFAANLKEIVGHGQMVIVEVLHEEFKLIEAV